MREILLLVNGKMLNEDLVDWYCSVMTVRYPVDRSKVRVMSCAISQLIMRDDRSFNADRVLQAHLDPDERKEVPWKTIFEYERIIFPVCHGKHFVVVEIDPQERYVSLYDSTQGMSTTPGPTASVVKTRFKRYVEVQAKECGALASDFQYEFTIGLPMQQNGFDCGLYAIERIAVLLGAPAPRLATYSGGVAVMRAEMLRDFIKAAYEALWPATN